MTTPHRSIEQRMTALNRANEIRCGRAVIHRAVRTGERDLLPILAGDIPDSERDLLATAPVSAVLGWRKRMSRKIASEILAQARIPAGTLISKGNGYARHGGRTMGELWRMPAAQARLIRHYEQRTAKWGTYRKETSA
jgi:hypothetical protein